MIVLLNGLSRSGKDTVAGKFVTHGFRHEKISKNLKQVVCAMFGLSAEEVEDHRKDQINKTYLVTPRALMKFVGTDVGQREIQKVLPNWGRTFWIQRLMLDMKPGEHDYVISDYRFLHEYIALQQTFPSCTVVRVRVEPRFHGFTEPHTLDETERTLAYDHVIYNKTLSQVYTDIDRLIETLKK
jgi:dephospho-CoA kinase